MNLVAPVLKAARAAGVDTDGLLRAAGIHPSAAIEASANATDYIDLQRYFRLWECAITTSGLPHLPLLAAQIASADSFGVIGFACMTSTTVADAFANLARYGHALNAASSWSRHDDGDMVRLQYQIAPGGSPLGHRGAVEFALAEVFHCANLIVGRRLPVRQVCLPHAPATDDEPYRHFFDAPVRWSQPHAALLLDAQALELPLAKADSGLRAYFVDRAEALVSQHATAEALSARVQRLLVDALPGGAPSLDEVAGRLAVSARSLRRHLAAEGTSYHDLVEKTRSELAQRYLQDPKLTVSEIATLVGFSEPSPFLRAFRRWTKLSPSVYRERMRAT